MSVRSITVKLIVPRKTEGLPEASSLWSTHVAVNRAVAYYEDILLEMRGECYQCAEDKIVTAKEITASLDRRINEACRNNGLTRSLSIEELSSIRQLLRSLYEAIVPSSIGEKGDAQQSNAFISPLTDPESAAFQSIFEKIGNCPSWLEGCRNGNPDAFSKAEDWLKTAEGRARIAATGAPPKWVRMVRKHDPGWPQACVQDHNRKLKDAKGVPTIIKALKDREVIPLFSPYLAPQIEGAKGKVSPWDRLAFRLAVGHLLSWESWCRKSANDHAQRLKRRDDFQNTYLDREETKDAVQALRRYEQERTAELSTLGHGPVSFKIRTRMVRSWDELRAKWLALSHRSTEKLWGLSADMQTRWKGSFGDPHLFAWLARAEHHFIWNNVSADVVTLVAQANALTGLLERSRERAIMTLPDPVLHPRCVQWEPEGGSNLKNYKMVVREGNLFATLCLLQSTPEGGYKEQDIYLPVAPSSQLRNVVIENGSLITYQNQTDETFSGTLRSADMLFDWSYFQHRPEGRLSSGDIGPVYLKLVIDVQPKLPEGWSENSAGFINHFRSALGNEKHANTVKTGLRVLSVDLGLRCFASCSVFELHEKQPNNGKLRYPAGIGLWAVHERSFMLRIPGEELDSKDEVWRRAAQDELRGLRRSLSRYRSFYRLPGMTDEVPRRELLDDTIARLEKSDNGLPFELDLFKEIRKQTSLPHEAWQAAVETARSIHKTEMGKAIGKWRTHTRRRDRLKSMGKSMWAIEYLTDVRRFLVGWSMLGNASGEIRRLDKAGRGVFASRLLKHIDGIKDDRLKTGADLIVQAARGYLRDAMGKWQNKYAPCHVVLFEDLSRYRMKTDRPRRENSQLMRWAHRQIPAEVQLQGELYGINTCDTDAAFSSRFHSATITPGVRCHPMTAEDLANPRLREFVEQENPAIKWSTLKPGSIVPLSGGELFVCLGNGRLTQINADINAAQNLQRRLWTRHSTPIRIPCRCVKVAGDVHWLPRSIGKRLKGAMDGLGWLVPTGDPSGSCTWEKLAPKQWRSLGGAQSEEEAPLPRDELFDLEGFEESLLESSGEVVVFFRDPSGVALSNQYWFPSKHFWGVVKAKTSRELLSLHSVEQRV